MVLAPFLMLLLGTVSAGLAVYTAASMHYAAEGAARCYSVSTAANAGSCTTTAKAQSYAQKIYFGLGSPTFTASTPACRYQVNATLNVVLNAGVKQDLTPAQ